MYTVGVEVDWRRAEDVTLNTVEGTECEHITCQSLNDNDEMMTEIIEFGEHMTRE